MSCGFGAVVLIFLIINHETEEKAKVVNKDLLAEIRLLDYQVRNGEEDLFELIERLKAIRQRLDNSDLKLASTEADLEETRDEFGDLSVRSRAEEESLNELKTDVEAREEELERLRAIDEANEGARSARFCRRRRPAVPDRPQGRRRQHPHRRGRLGQHARRNHRQRAAPSQHARRAAAHGAEMAARREHRGMAQRATAAGLGFPDLHLQYRHHLDPRRQQRPMGVARRRARPGIRHRPPEGRDPRRRHEPDRPGHQAAQPRPPAGQRLPDRRLAAHPGHARAPAPDDLGQGPPRPVPRRPARVAQPGADQRHHVSHGGRPARRRGRSGTSPAPPAAPSWRHRGTGPDEQAFPAAMWRSSASPSWTSSVADSAPSSCS